jgi:hypothetical protein
VSSAAPSARYVAGWPVAFRGSAAVRAGLVTPGQLRGPAYLRLFPDTYVRRAAEPPKLPCAPTRHTSTLDVAASCRVTRRPTGSAPNATRRKRLRS